MCFTSEEICGDESMIKGFCQVLDLSVFFFFCLVEIDLCRFQSIFVSVIRSLLKISSKYNNSLVY